MIPSIAPNPHSSRQFPVYSFLQDDIKGFLFKLTLLRLRNNLIYLWCSWWGLRPVFWALKGSMTKWGDLVYELTKTGAQDIISGKPETYELGRRKRTMFSW